MKHNPKYDKFEVKQYNHWRVYIHENQYYLGRCVIWAKQEDFIDFMDMTEEERKELFDIGNRLKGVLNKLFRPDLFNWASLANETPHLHVHVIPRYKEKREFEGKAFADENWGTHYMPYDRNLEYSKELLFKIRDSIKEELD